MKTVLLFEETITQTDDFTVTTLYRPLNTNQQFVQARVNTLRGADCYKLDEKHIEIQIHLLQLLPIMWVLLKKKQKKPRLCVILNSKQG